MRRWPQFMQDRSDLDSARARSGSRFSQCGCSSLAGHFPASAIRRRRNRPPSASDSSGVGNQVSRSLQFGGEASIENHSRRMASLSPALQRMPRRERPGRRLFSRWRRRRHVTAFPGKPPTRVERIFTGDSAYVASNGDCRSMYYSSEPRIEITEPAAIGEQLPHGRQKPVG